MNALQSEHAFDEFCDIAQSVLTQDAFKKSGEYQVLKIQLTPLSNTRAGYMEITGKNYDDMIGQLIFFIDVKGQGVTMRFEAPLEKFEQYKPVFLRSPIALS